MARYKNMCARRSKSMPANRVRDRLGKVVPGHRSLMNEKIKPTTTLTYVRKQSHKGEKINTWSEQNMKHAVEEWQNQCTLVDGPKVSIRMLARAWNIPYETLRKRITGKVSGFAQASGRPTVLSAKDEDELVKVVKSLADVGFPMTRNDVQQLAFTYPKEHEYKGFSSTKSNAGYYWFQGFLKRHPDVNVKKAENLSIARAMGMNKTQVCKWFESYEDFLSRLGVRDLPRHIWNLDETGVQNIHKAEQVVAAVGQPVYNMTAVEKGETCTILPVINAFGDIPPPMVIHRGKLIGKGWKDGAPFGTLIRASENGWINKLLFVEFGEHFVKYIKSHEALNNGLPHVIVMDNHYSHAEFLNLMRNNNIHVFALPSHTTHWLQPLDRVPFGTFERQWNEEMRLFTRNTAGRKLEKREFFKVFTPVWQKSMTVELAQSGFRATGLFPVNVHAVPDVAFASSAVTERPLTSEEQPPQNQTSGRPTQATLCY